jgi:hypothetical protein
MADNVSRAYDSIWVARAVRPVMLLAARKWMIWSLDKGQIKAPTASLTSSPFAASTREAMAQLWPTGLTSLAVLRQPPDRPGESAPAQTQLQGYQQDHLGQSRRAPTERAG